MHMQIVTFQLKDMDDIGFRKLCDELAPTWEALPGLINKVWLTDPATGTYGGVYTWETRAVCESYLRSDLYANVRRHPNFSNVTSRDYAVIEAPTRVTRGLDAAVAR